MSQQPAIDSQRALVQQYFEKHAQEWQDIYWAQDLSSFNIQQRQAYVLGYVDALGLPPGTRILDLGCGAGLTAVKLLERGYEVVGIDVSENMLELARQNCAAAGLAGRGSFQLGNAEGLEADDASFDLIIAMGLIEYLRWDRWALQEMYRVLKPGGHLIVTGPNQLRLSFLVDPVRLAWLGEQKVERTAGKVLARLFGARVGRRKFDRHLYVLSHLDRVLRGLGFEIVASVSHGFGPFTLLRRWNAFSLKLNRRLEEYSTRPGLRFLGRHGSNYVALCRRRELPAEIDQRPIFSNISQWARNFESDKRRFFAPRGAWLRQHPDHAGQKLTEVDVSEYSDATVLVLSPHPDDEIIGCGGTLIKLVATGTRVTVAQLTDGRNSIALRDVPKEQRKTVRLNEAKAVADSLGFAELISWGKTDSELKPTPEDVRALADLLTRLRPRAVFVPFIVDEHRDHVAANVLLGLALRTLPELDGLEVFSYEVWSAVPPNSFCVIDNQFDRKAQALMKYRTGMKAVDYVHSCEALSAYHAYTLLNKKGFAEVFQRLSAPVYLELLPSQR